MRHTLHETATTVDGHTVPVTVTSWKPRETIEAAVGELDLDVIVAAAAEGPAIHYLTPDGEGGGLDAPVPRAMTVVIYVASAADGGDLRTIVYVHEGRTADLVGVTEAARLAGITRSGVVKAYERGRMPAPLPVAGSDVLVWHRGDIDRWLAERS
jgi:predicted DNA-binding transcriptional regulator AlpA